MVRIDSPIPPTQHSRRYSLKLWLN